MSHNYKVEAITELTQRIKGAGFRVFIAKSGTYGLYTDEAGSRVVCFQYDLGGFKFSGNYKSKTCGAGWGIGDSWEVSPEGLQAMLYSNAPSWATKGEQVTLTTLAQHLATYQWSSNYTEVVSTLSQSRGSPTTTVCH